MEIKIRFANLDKPNANNIILNKSAVESACKKIENISIPVKLVDQTTDDINKIIGCANLSKVEYPNTEFSVHIHDRMIEHILKDYAGGFAIGGLAKYNNKEVEELNIKHLGLCSNPAYSSSFEIIREGEDK